MSGKIRKIGPFTQSTRVNRSNMADAWHGLGHEWYAAPGATQHHDRVLRRENMGQKKTPEGDVRNKKRR